MSPNQNFSTTEVIRYIPAVLHEQKTGDWRINYYAIHPQKNELTQVRIRVNKIRDAYPKKTLARKHIAEMCLMINAKLAGGWSPFFDGEDARLYVSLVDVAEQFMNAKKREMRENTIRSYSSFCNQLTNWSLKNAPQIYMSLFNHNYAIRYMDYLFVERKVGNSTYNNNIKMGRALFNWAIERCYTKQNAFEKIKPKKKETKKRIIIPKDVRQKITDHLHDSGNIGMEIAVNLIYSSLIRPNEIRQLKISNIFLDEKYIIVPSEVAKNHNQRTSAMTDHTIDLIKKMIAGKKYSKDFYLLGGDLLPAANQAGAARLRHEWDKITKELKIPKTMQLYSFRDTGIFEMLKSGIDNLTVMQHADHSSLDITTRYANHFDAALVDKINKLVPDF